MAPWPCQSHMGLAGAEGSVWLLLSPWGAGTCPHATKSLCRKMLLAFPAVCFFWPEFSQCHLELPCGWSHGELPQVPRTEPGTATQPQPPAQPWVAAKGAAQAGDGACCPQPAQQWTHKNLTHTFIVTETSQTLTKSLPQSKAAPAPTRGVPWQTPLTAAASVQPALSCAFLSGLPHCSQPGEGFHGLGERHTNWELNCPSATQQPALGTLPAEGQGFPH